PHQIGAQGGPGQLAHLTGAAVSAGLLSSSETTMPDTIGQRAATGYPTSMPESPPPSSQQSPRGSTATGTDVGTSWRAGT
ncbi:MAG: hypothetical protein WB989_21225, partial [Mycobacterium sp.]